MKKLKLIFSKGMTIPDVEMKSIVKFTKWTIKRLKLKSDDIHISFVKKEEKKGTLSIGEFEENTKHIFIRKEGRSLIDVLRSVVYELEYLKQNEDKWADEKDKSGVDWKREDDSAKVSGQLIKIFVKEFKQEWLYRY